MDHRLHRVNWGVGGERKRTSLTNWRKPLSWNRHAKDHRPRVFCASLADVFDNAVPASWRTELWRLIRETPNLDWLLLTKRIPNARKMLPPNWGVGFANVWLGITVVTQEEADRDIPMLLATPAHTRFLSCEPLLEQVDFHGVYGWLSVIDWVIVGGESGAHARPLSERWCLSIARQCQRARTAFFMKQGSRANWPHWRDPSKWPRDLRVRDFPTN